MSNEEMLVENIKQFLNLTEKGTAWEDVLSGKLFIKSEIVYFRYIDLKKFLTANNLITRFSFTYIVAILNKHFQGEFVKRKIRGELIVLCCIEDLLNNQAV